MGAEILRRSPEFLRYGRRFSDFFDEPLRFQCPRQEFGKVTLQVVVIVMDVVQEVDKPVIDIDPNGFAAAHHRVHHRDILGSVVVAAEEVTFPAHGHRPLPILNQVGVDPVTAVDDISA